MKLVTLAVVLGLARAGLLPQWFPHGISPLHEPSPSRSATWEPSACTSSTGSGLAVFAGSVPYLQLEPHRFLKCREL